ncbi:MAG TPA: response regulator [Tepidisphaeraceae bacterium]|jgi:DNA-binding response OmpR family regulator|nr:response regulator [Tepidisphaeraceae bacterium]
MSTVLVVDDQPEMRLLFQRVLENQGYTVVSAENGQDGLRVIDQCNPQLVLLDMAMPRMDGLGFLQAIRAQARWAKLPVIMLSGLMTAEQVAVARELGVSDRLVKAEFSMKELRARVAKHVPAPVSVSKAASA